MKKSLFDGLFNDLIGNEEFNKMVNEVFDGVYNRLKEDFDITEKEDKKVDDKKDGIKSYLNESGTRYEDGELVEKYEREFVDGECTKDEKFVKNGTSLENKSENKCLCDDKKECDKKECKRKRTNPFSSVFTNPNREGFCRKMELENEKMKKELEEIKKLNDDMGKYIDGLNDKIKSLELERANLKKIIDNVKNCF